MSKYKKNIPFFSSLLLVIVFEAVLKYPKYFFLYPLVFLIVFFSLFYMTGYSFSQKKLWYLFLAPILLFTGSFLFLYFVETGVIKQILIFSAGLFNWFLFKNYYRYVVFGAEHKKSTENILSYVTVVTAFFFFSSFFALRIFMNMSLLWLELFVLILSLLLILQNFWLEEISLKKNWLFLFGLCLIFAEAFWTAIFLPTHFLVNGLFMTILLYVLINLSNLTIAESLNNKILSRYLIFGFSLTVIIFLTAQWL